MIKTLEALIESPALSGIDFLFANNLLRSYVLRAVDKEIYRRALIVNATKRPARVQWDKYYTLRNMLYALDNAVRKGNISSKVRKKLLQVFIGKIFLKLQQRRSEILKIYEELPPGFITISPTQICNLDCPDCYAASSAEKKAKLEFSLVNRIIKEKTALWLSHFTVISAGEPLMWKSEGKDMLDLVEENQDNFFLMFTNGTLITSRIVKKMADAGNITPAISVEGFAEETDRRRGKGVHQKILKAIEALKKEGVPWGISLTATRHNAELILSDELIDYYFNQLGAVFGWIFHYMPIGREFTLDLMVTPEQRLRMYEREQQLLRKTKIFFADFWNSGTVSDGCLSAGRDGGYFYIDWNGDIMPCVFAPYSTQNIREVYAQGGDLNTVWNSPFFKSIRQWQNEYSYLKPTDQIGNQLVPCPIRDHYNFFRENLVEKKAKPVGPEAAEALQDLGYYHGLVNYGRETAKLTESLWHKRYLEPEQRKNQNLH